MQQDIAAETLRYLAASSSGVIAAAASVGLSEQLNAGYDYMDLQLPYWTFLLSMIVLNFVGAFLSLKIDYIRQSGSVIDNFITAVIVGLVLSFVVLPYVSPKSSVGLMQITSFVSGLCGTVLLRIVINVLSNKELVDSITDMIVGKTIRFLNKAIDIIYDHALELLIAALVALLLSVKFLPDVIDDYGNDEQYPTQTEYSENFDDS